MSDDVAEDTLLNPVLGARIIWSAIAEYQKSNTAMSLAIVLLALPIVLHRRSRHHIYNMNKSGGSVEKALRKVGDGANRAIVSGYDLALGLQERVHYLTPLTLESLNLGIAAGLIKGDKPDSFGFPTYTTAINKLPLELRAENDDFMKRYLQAGERLGAWFSHSTVETIYSSLRIKV